LGFVDTTPWSVEYTDEFEAWWHQLTAHEQRSIDAGVLMLAQFGPRLGRPYSDTVKGSRHANLKELRVQHGGDPYRVLYAFDPRRCAILLIGGNKTGDDRWYARMIPVADDLYDEHLETLRREGLIDG
jgi:hypothetical protein